MHRAADTALPVKAFSLADCSRRRLPGEAKVKSSAVAESRPIVLHSACTRTVTAKNTVICISAAEKRADAPAARRVFTHSDAPSLRVELRHRCQNCAAR